MIESDGVVEGDEIAVVAGLDEVVFSAVGDCSGRCGIGWCCGCGVDGGLGDFYGGWCRDVSSSWWPEYGSIRLVGEYGLGYIRTRRR